MLLGLGRMRVAALAGERVVSVAAGDYMSLAITAGGVLWAWGRNIDGELGVGSTDNQRRPV